MEVPPRHGSGSLERGTSPLFDVPESVYFGDEVHQLLGDYRAFCFLGGVELLYFFKQRFGVVL